MDSFLPDTFKIIAENVVLFGGAVMGIYYGLKRVYTTARNVEKLVENSEKNSVAQEAVRADLSAHTQLENERDSKRDERATRLEKSLEELAADLRAHVKMEEDRDLIRDQQLITLTDHMEEVVNEMRPNGGSSMKDILTKSSQKVDEVNTRLSVIEQWKNDHVKEIEPIIKSVVTRKPKAKKRIVRRSGRP
jgi:DNA anti-recombination protein RmuC